ncbi:HD domain-containing phosphohydrolase [Acetivibrio clariflavus]|uniref:HD-GYP domain-containing protein n=1 Tax=Acetivibrio clariflavus (strain DSM 19732 / NBRC 101661 / EBR45) TaxID=720554 RepID=G8LXU1_ACECE|nr:HD domain-containing phosphohydrolase [Acetivibrio clariflavus]AEV68844.1 HD-GYP domain-containing protein [Acetivibrio clariflavus DSM 19732]
MLKRSPVIEYINYIFGFIILFPALIMFAFTKSLTYLLFILSSIVYIAIVCILIYCKRKDVQLKYSMDDYNELSEIVRQQREKIEEIEGELISLHDALKIITSTFDLNTIIVYTTKLLNKYTECEWYYVCFINKNMGKPDYKYEYGEACSAEIDKSEIEKYIDEAYNSGIIDNIQVVSDKNKGDTIIIPLSVSKELIGVIYAGTSVVGRFSKINLNFLESLANFTAISVKNAEMYNNIYHQKQEIEALYEQAAASNEALNAYIKELDETKVELAKKNVELTKFYNEIQYGYLQTVMCLANSIEAKDPYTRGHCQRVMEISCELGRAMGLSEDDIEDLRYAAILHDIGKIGISASILNKPGKLTEEEFNEIKKHPSIAYNILKDVDFLRNGLDGVLQHHERYDGKGYPNGLKKDEICIFGRILCVADAFDAMTSDRPYRKGMSMEDAIKELERCKGTQFDPQIVDVLISMVQEKMN